MPSNKPTTLLSLPPELLIPILALASPTSSDPTGSTRYSLSQLRLTCRALYDLSTSLFWEDVNVPGEYGEGRGKAGHAEAMGRLLMIREAREGVRRMLFRIPDGSYLLSAALLGSFRNLSNLSIVFIRPETREVAISRSITQGLVDLPHLSSLTLSGFTGIEDPSFRLSSLRLPSLALVNCQHLDSLLGSSPFVKSLELVADASDRPIDTVLSPEQWDSLERLELEGTVLADFFNVPGLLPPYLISSLRDHPHPPQIRTLDLRYFSAAPSDGMQVLTRLRPEKLQLRTSSGKLFSELESWPKALWAHTTDAILAPVDWPDLLLVVEHVVRCFPALERLDLVADSEGPAHGVGLLLRELAGVLSASRVRKIKLVVGYRAEWYCLSRSPGEDAFAGVGSTEIVCDGILCSESLPTSPRLIPAPLPAKRSSRSPTRRHSISGSPGLGDVLQRELSNLHRCAARVAAIVIQADAASKANTRAPTPAAPVQHSDKVVVKMPASRPWTKAVPCLKTSTGTQVNPPSESAAPFKIRQAPASYQAHHPPPSHLQIPNSLVYLPYPSSPNAHDMHHYSPPYRTIDLPFPHPHSPPYAPHDLPFYAHDPQQMYYDPLLLTPPYHTRHPHFATDFPPLSHPYSPSESTFDPSWSHPPQPLDYAQFPFVDPYSPYASTYSYDAGALGYYPVSEPAFGTSRRASETEDEDEGEGGRTSWRVAPWTQTMRDLENGAVLRRRGTTKFFDEQKGFGFILQDDIDEIGGRDIFVHYTAILMKTGFRCLNQNEPVEYDVVCTAGGGYQALNVSGAHGAPLKGLAEAVVPVEKGRKRKVKAVVLESEGE